MDQKTAEFVAKARQIHGDFYDYSEFVYRGNQVKGTIHCPIDGHGPFEKDPNHHIQGRAQGCPKCSRQRKAEQQTLSRAEFLAKATAVHGDRYHYGPFVYVNSTTKGTILCRVHGPFTQMPCHHLSGSGCPDCAKLLAKQTSLARYGVEHHSQSPEFVQKVRRTSLSRFGVEHRSKSSDFREAMRQTNLARYGVEFVSQLPSFVERVKQTNQERYGTPHRNSNHIPTEGLAILANREGVIAALDGHSLAEAAKDIGVTESTLGKYCKKYGIELSRSSYEDAIAQFLRNRGITVIRGNRKIIRHGEIDLLLPDHKIGIEFGGLWWHREARAPKRYHLDKLVQMEKIGYRLITIFLDEWLDRRRVVETRLLHAISQSPRGKGARQLVIEPLTPAIARGFLHQHHIQGAGQAGFARYGAFDDEQLVAVMTFSRPRLSLGRKQGAVELLRFATDGKSYPGVASRLFKTFVRQHNPECVVSYADRRWSDGGMYRELGFDLAGETQPNYWYIDKRYRKREHRFNYRKDRIKHLVENGDQKTERQIMEELGRDRIWDCGSLKFEWTK